MIADTGLNAADDLKLLDGRCDLTEAHFNVESAADEAVRKMTVNQLRVVYVDSIGSRQRCERAGLEMRRKLFPVSVHDPDLRL